MKLIKRLIIVSFMAVILISCASTTDPSDAYKGEPPQQIFLKGKKALQDNNYQEAVKRLEALTVQYPFGENQEHAELYLMYAYYMKEDYALAVATANQFIRVHPTSQHVAYAYYIRGVAHYYQNMGVLERIFAIDLATRDLTQIHKSYEDFSQITNLFPNSRFAPAARQYQVYLRNVLANHEFRVAAYYYDRKAYLAAINRANDVVAHYQGAPAVVPSLALLAKAYHQLGMNKEEGDVLTVINYNYPGLTINYKSGYGM